MPDRPGEQPVLRGHGLAGHALDVRQQRTQLAADRGVHPLGHAIRLMAVGRRGANCGRALRPGLRDGLEQPLQALLSVALERHVVAAHAEEAHRRLHRLGSVPLLGDEDRQGVACVDVRHG
eukprot:9003-Alexandrium_andersonii.AAC.1